MSVIIHVLVYARSVNLIPSSKYNLPLIGAFMWPSPPGRYRATTCRGRELNYGSHTYFFTTKGHGGPPQMSDQPNAGATSETAQTWNTVHTKHTLSHPNKTKIEWWLRHGQMIFGDLGGLKFHDICLTGEEKSQEKPHPGNLSQPGIEPGPATWQAHMLLPVSQRWTPTWCYYGHCWCLLLIYRHPPLCPGTFPYQCPPAPYHSMNSLSTSLHIFSLRTTSPSTPIIISRGEAWLLAPVWPSPMLTPSWAILSRLP